MRHIGLTLIGCLVLLPQMAGATDDLEIHFIDVGQGDSTLINCPDGPAILVDAGTLPSYKKKPGRLRKYIKGHLDGRWVETVVVTHADSDHYNMLKSALKSFKLKALIYAGETQAYSWGTRNWLKSGKTAEKTHHLRWDKASKTWKPRPTIDCGKATVEIIAAAVPGTKKEMGNYPYPDGWRKNSVSIVLRVSYGDFDAILTGDATRDTENYIMSQHSGSLEAEVLKIGHHGSSRTSNSAKWLKAVSPELAVASAGRCNKNEHPTKKVIDRIEPFTPSAPAHPIWLGVSNSGGCNSRFDYKASYKEAIYSTAASGTVVVITDGTEYQVDTEK